MTDFDHLTSEPQSLRAPSGSATSTEERPESPTPASAASPPAARRQKPTVRVGAVVALAIAAGLAAWLVLRDSGSSKPATAGSGASAASANDLASLASSVSHPVFWLGPRSGYTYELTRTRTGKIYVRYLPAGVAVGSSKPYLTVATYPFPGAFAALVKQAGAQGAIAVDLPQGGLAVLDRSHPKSTRVAYPSVDYQVEVFDPTPRAALQAVAAGQLAALGELRVSPRTTPTPVSRPTAVSEATLKSLSAALGRPIYWAGPMEETTYELTRTSNGNVYVRYLPAGVPVGAPAGYLTVATYPFPGALAALRKSAKGKGAAAFQLAGGGLALVDGKSIHLAYPHLDYQVEVFDPSPARALQVVGSGKIAAIS